MVLKHVQLWDLTVKDGLGQVSASLLEHIHGTGERHRAEELVKGLLRQVYTVAALPGVSDTSFYQLHLTSKGLGSKKAGACPLLGDTTWPEWTCWAVEQSGLSNAELLDSKKILLECHLADKNLSLIYILPPDCRALFPHGDPVQQVHMGKPEKPEIHISTPYCKYLQVGLCHHCRASPAAGSKLQACGRCKKGCYCNRDCQAADWPEHKTVCKMLKGLREAAAARAAEHAAANLRLAAAGAAGVPPRCSSMGACSVFEEAAPP